ncbi:MAG: nuclease [Verrucomicrobiales bacterium]|nr:nuclease [Verrucomicrobiales bacterium]
MTSPDLTPSSRISAGGGPVSRNRGRWIVRRAGIVSSMFLIVGLAAPGKVRAWNAEGHMAVAQIAYNHLHPTVKAKCDALIAVPLTYGGTATNTFVTAACWADDFKSQLGSGTWHYIDLPISLDGTSYASFVPPSFDVVQAINQSIATFRNPSATDAQQAISLRYLIHFLADIQQPLHCSAAFFASQPGGDAGGNGYPISGTYNNLHSLWDSGGGYLADSLPRPLSTASRTTLNNRVATIEAAHPYQSVEAGRLPDVMVWAQEAKSLAVTICYSGIALNTAPSAGYLQTARSTTEARIALGGQRLADLLNTLLAVNPTPFRASNGDFGVSWNAVVGATYYLEWTDDPADPTWNVRPPITASSRTATFQEPMIPGRRFYRLRR